MDAVDDGEVTIETEHPENLQNETPVVVQSGINYVLQLLSSNGWFIVGICIFLWWVKGKLEPVLERRRRQQQSVDSNVDPDVAQARYAAMDAARRRMQEEHDAKMERWKEQQKIKEEQQRQQKIDDWENHKAGLGYRSKMKKPAEDNTTAAADKDKQPFTSSTRPRNRLRQNDYNPMVGHGGSGGGWRPSRPTTGGG